MAFETVNFVQGPSRAYLLFSSISHHQMFQTYVASKQESRKSAIWKSKNPGSLTSAQAARAHDQSDGDAQMSQGQRSDEATAPDDARAPDDSVEHHVLSAQGLEAHEAS